jgi:hypothetical protein
MREGLSAQGAGDVIIGGAHLGHGSAPIWRPMAKAGQSALGGRPNLI